MVSTSARIRHVADRVDGVLVDVEVPGVGTAQVELSWFWLRDHSEDPSSLDPVTLQRTVDTFSLGDVGPGRSEHSDERLIVHWLAHDQPSHLGAATVAAVAGLTPPPRRTLWDASHFADPIPCVPFESVTGGEGLLAWLTSVENYGFGVVSGAPRSPAAIADLADRVGPPRNTIFGTMWPLSSEITDHSDSAYSTTYLEPHTDSTYLPDAPGLQLFGCIERSGNGGESILVDGYAIAEKLRAESPEEFDVLSTVSVPGRYVEPGVHLRASRPTLRLGADEVLEQVSFNNYDRAPFVLGAASMAAWYRAYSHFHELVVDRSNWLTIALRPGDVLLIDNWRVLHGRMQFDGRRVFEGCYHHREDFLSRLDVLRNV